MQINHRLRAGRPAGHSGGKRVGASGVQWAAAELAKRDSPQAESTAASEELAARHRPRLGEPDFIGQRELHGRRLPASARLTIEEMASGEIAQPLCLAT